MRPPAPKLLWLLIVLAPITQAIPAGADVIPTPERPADWNEHPAPAPAPPPEKEEIAAALVLVSGAALAFAFRLRRSTGFPGRARQPS